MTMWSIDVEDKDLSKEDKFFIVEKYKYNIKVKDIIIDLIVTYFTRVKPCFTYKSFRYWLYNEKRVKVEWHTVERVIRYLAQTKRIKRIYKAKNKVIFCRADY